MIRRAQLFINKESKVVGSSPTPATISLVNRIKIIYSVVRCIMEQLLDRRAQLL